MHLLSFVFVTLHAEVDCSSPPPSQLYKPQPTPEPLHQGSFSNDEVFDNIDGSFVELNDKVTIATIKLNTVFQPMSHFLTVTILSSPRETHNTESL